MSLEHVDVIVVRKVLLAHNAKVLDLSSGCILRSLGQFPKQGHRGPWRVRQNYVLDSLTTMRRGLRESMEFTPR